jgi:serine/threonine protein kinase
MEPFKIPSHDDERVLPDLPDFVKNKNPASVYQKVEVGGCGAFGAVYRVFQSSDGCQYAIKVIRTKRSPLLLEKALHEAKIALEMNHPMVIKTHEVYFYDDQIFLVMDLAALTSIKQMLPMLMSPIARRTTLRIMREIVAGISYIHSKGFLHGDIKSSNIGAFVDSSGTPIPCIFDLGESCQMDAVPKGLRGTITSMSPELVRTMLPSVNSDMWACICCFVEMLTGKLPISEFIAQNVHAHVIWKITQLTEPPIPAVFKTDQSPYGRLMLQILERGLSINPETRLTFPELDSLLQQLSDLLQ